MRSLGEYGILLIAAFLAAVILTPLLRRAAPVLGLLDAPNERKVHKIPTPLLGGGAVLLGMLIAVGIVRTFGWIPAGESSPLMGITLGTMLLFAVGLADDKWGIGVKAKFAAQIAAALILVWYEVRVSVFIRNNLLTTLITIVWIVGITNAFNLLDNMDGLTSGVGAIASAGFFFVAWHQGQPLVAILSVALAGACLGFLLYNLHPASIFLGDAGSMVIGFLLAAVSVQGVYLAESRLTHLPILTPLFILGVPIFDTGSVILIRLSRGLPVFKADKNHFSHRLVLLGLNQRRAVFLIYLVAIAVAIPATILSRVSLFEAVALLVHEVILFTIIVLLERANVVRKAIEESRRGK